MQLAIPQLENININDWDHENNPLPIAIVTQNRSQGFIPSIKVDGSINSISITEEPDELYLVVSSNERTIAIPKESKGSEANLLDPGLDCVGEPYMVDDSYEYILLDDYYEAQNDCTIESIPNTSGGGSGSTSSNCTRDNDPDKDEITKVKFKNMQAYRQAKDGWFNGRFELKLFVTLGNINGVPQTLEKMFINNEHDYRYCGIFNCDPRWVNTLAEIITWDKSVFGDRMNYSFFEYDGTGSTTETTVSFPVKIGNTTLTISNKLSVKSDDFPIGQSEIEYCDNSQGEGYTYSAGSFEFQVRQK